MVSLVAGPEFAWDWHLLVVDEDLGVAFDEGA